jgi:ornithine cyclodeaminase/alanine dehydrogenase-like protein (mu-crystallin family)
MRSISETDLRQVITPQIAVDTMREAFRADGEGRAHVPAVINLDVPAHRGEFHVKTALIDGVPHVAVKIASGFYDNPSMGLPSGSGLMAVFDAATGMPVALLLDNGFLTDIRTGAAGAIAAEALAPARFETLGVIGSGVQARHQVHCLRCVRAFTRIIAWSPDRSHLDAYVREMRDGGYDASAAATPEAVCRDAEVIVTATPARQPLIRADRLRPGHHVTALGSDSPGKQELEAGCLSRADLVVADRLTQCASFGELRHALDAHLLRPDQVHAELGEVVATLKSGRTAGAQITIADLTGVGFQDTAIASAALRAIG